MIEKMAPKIFEKYELNLLKAENLKYKDGHTSDQIARKDNYWSFMSWKEMTEWNNGVFFDALKEFNEARTPEGQNLNATSSDNLYEDYDFWIRSGVQWWFYKYTVGGTWPLATQYYNGANSVSYKDDVYSRVTGAAEIDVSGQ